MARWKSLEKRKESWKRLVREIGRIIEEYGPGAGSIIFGITFVFLSGLNPSVGLSIVISVLIMAGAVILVSERLVFATRQSEKLKNYEADRKEIREFPFERAVTIFLLAIVSTLVFFIAILVLRTVLVQPVSTKP